MIRDDATGRFVGSSVPGECRRGHIEFYADGRCRVCVQEKNARYKTRRPASTRAYANEYMRTVGRWRKYGLTREQFLALAAEHGGMCAICQEKPAAELCIDHNHATGKVRGMLCGNCNKAIGFLRESQELAQRTALYLRHYA